MKTKATPSTAPAKKPREKKYSTELIQGKKPKKPRAKAIKYSTELFSGEVSLDELTDWPEIAGVPTLEDAAQLDTLREGPALDWEDLRESVEEMGLIERLKVMRNPAGGWWVADGRSRRAALRSLGRTGNVKVEEVTEGDAARLAVATMRRRMVPRFVRAYLGCLEHADELLARGRGRPRKGALPDDSVSQLQLAAQCRVSVSTINSCLCAIRHFRENPGDRAEMEPKILAGLMSPDRVQPAIEGRKATAGKTRTPFSWVTTSPHLSALTTNFKAWDKWSEGDRDNFRRGVGTAVREWPAAVRGIIAELLQF